MKQINKMKQICILTTVLFLNCSNLFAQTEVITGLLTPLPSIPRGIAINGNDLYIAQYFQQIKMF